MKHKGTILLVVIAAALAAAVIGVFGYAAWQKIAELEGVNERVTKELSSYRKSVYTALEDISEGDEIITEGDGANVILSVVYSSLDDDIYWQGDTAFAAEDIAAGDPVLSSDTSEEEVPVKETSVVIEYEAGYTIPYVIKAVFADEEGNELFDAKVLQLPEGVSETVLSTYAADVEGYALSQILVGEEEAYSIGASDVQLDAGTETVYFYSDARCGTRTEITEDLEITFVYEAEDKKDEEG